MLSESLDLSLADYDSRAIFWSRLFEVMSRDLLPNDPRVTCLHARDRGYGHLIRTRAVLPTLLPAPFDRLVCASAVKWYASGALADNKVLVATQGWCSARGMRGRIVSEEIRTALQKIGFENVVPRTLSQLLHVEMGSEQQIEVDLGNRLGMVAIARESIEWSKILDVASTAKFRAQDGVWRGVGSLSSKRRSDSEERLLCGFAPDSALLHDCYKGESLEFFEIARRHSEYGQRWIETLLKWVRCVRDDDDGRQRAVIEYLKSGRHRMELTSILRHDCPDWMREMASQINEIFRDDTYRNSILVAALSPNGKSGENGEGGNGGLTVTKDILVKLYEWWESVREQERARYWKRVYPSGFRVSELRVDGIDRGAWFTMFALACYQSFGRTQDGQHRRFIEHGMNAGWWQGLAQPIDDEDWPWRDRLRQWTSPSPDEQQELPGQEFLQWKRTLVDLYAIARGLEDFVLLLQAFPRFVVHATSRPSLLEVLVPGESKLAEKLGTQSAPQIDRTLGIGANWLMRELSRNGVYDSDQASLMAPYCWMPSRRVRVLLMSLDPKNRLDYVDANCAVSERIYDLVVAELGEDRARFWGDYDLPLQIVTRRERRGLLAQWFTDSGMDFPDFREETDSEDHG